MHRIGLRFPRSQARTLTNIAQRIRAGELGQQHVTVFEQAAEAARTGEPMIVVCEDPIEAVLIAEGYVRFGVARPAIEQLNGTLTK